MPKQKKKRTKVYSGSNAASVRPTVTRISAINRGRLGQWLYEHKQYRKPALIAVAVLFGIFVVIMGIISLLRAV